MEEKRKKPNPDRAWYNHVCEMYRSDILYSVQKSILDEPVPGLHIVDGRHTEVHLYKTDTVTSLFAGTRCNPGDRYALLNFASYLNPGGGFLSGARAQEEALCRESILYPVLVAFTDVWYKHHRVKCPGSYGNDYIMSPEVLFVRNNLGVRADVLTMAAVNRDRCKLQTARYIQEARMDIAYRALGLFEADRIIIGAWGCGVFKNDPKEIAEYWRDIINKHDGAYKEVVIAILDRKMYDVFCNVFEVCY